jgi:ATP-dependent DNA ligase
MHPFFSACRRGHPHLAKALYAMPDETVIDGEVVALNESGRPSFNTLQNYGSSRVPVLYYAFDVLVLSGRSVMNETLDARRHLLETKVLSKLSERIRSSPVLSGSLKDLIHAVKEQGLEGLVAKRRDSCYEPGERSGSWQKMRVNRGQEFVIGRYTPSPKNFDALIFGYFEASKLIYVARTRNGFAPRLREDLFKRLKKFESEKCPFANLPETRNGRWGQGLTAAKMKECRWLRPVLVSCLSRSVTYGLTGAPGCCGTLWRVAETDRQ